jgi:sec-independent protein translocase protein TatA
MGMPELIIILLVILIIFGPKNLPKLGSALGRAVKGVREGVEGVSAEFEAGKSASATNTGQVAQSAPVSATPAVTAVVEDVSNGEASAPPANTTQPNTQPSASPQENAAGASPQNTNTN